MIENLHDMDVYERVLGVMQNVEWVSKTGEVAFGKTNYAYVTETQILTDVRPWMVEYGLVMFPVQTCVHESKDGLTRASVTYQVAAAGYIGDGQQSIVVEVVAEGADSTDKGAYKMMTGALKAAIRQAFLIITGEPSDPEATDDQGTSTGNAVVEHPFDKARKRLKVAGVLNDVQVQNILKKYNIDLKSQSINANTVANARALSKFARGVQDGGELSQLLIDLDGTLT